MAFYRKNPVFANIALIRRNKKLTQKIEDVNQKLGRAETQRIEGFVVLKSKKKFYCRFFK